MSDGDLGRRAAGLAAAVLAYVLVMWGLLLFLFFLSEKTAWLPRFSILSGETLIPLALGSLLPVFGAERLLCRRFALPWLPVRLAVPCVGFILFLVTVICVLPVLLQNLFLLFPVVFFVLIQGTALLVSVCFTAICRNKRRARERSMEPVRSSDLRLRPIKLPPKSEQVKQRPVPKAPRAARGARRDWKSNVIAAVNVVAIIGGMLAMLLWFPSYQAALLFTPEVTRADIEAEPGFWSGRRAAGDIPRLTGLGELEDGTYDSLTYLTVETDQLIPLPHYMRKNNVDRISGSYGYSRARSRRRPLPVYTHSPGVNAMYYGQYYVVRLEDGSYIGAYMDSAYTTAFGRVQLPIGTLEHAGSVETALLTEAAGTYPVPTDRLLIMHDDRFYENIKLLDMSLRLGAVVLVPGVIFGGWLLLVLCRRKKR